MDYSKNLKDLLFKLENIKTKEKVNINDKDNTNVKDTLKDIFGIDVFKKNK